MKTFLLTALTLITHLTFGQETGSYQSDSVYKANNVKARLWYTGTNKQLSITTFYDRDGRLIQYQLEPFMDGAQRTTHYTYDSNGRLTGIVDTTRNGEPNKEQIEKLVKMGIDPNKLMKKDKNKPPIEVAKYELSYDDNELTRITKYNPDSSIDFIDYFKNNGKTKTRDWYRDGKVYRQNTTENLTEFHKERFYGWEIRNGKKENWDYRYKYEFSNGAVQNSTRYDGKKKMETTKYYYDKNGLLIKMDGYVPEFFEYVYY